MIKRSIISIILLFVLLNVQIQAKSVVFNPILPCKVEHHGQSQRLPLDIFGDGSGYVDMYQGSSHNETEFKFVIYDFGADKRDTRECQSYSYKLSQDENQVVTALNKKGGRAFKDIGIILTVDNTRYINNAQYCTISFYDYYTGELIGKQQIESASTYGSQVLSRRYFMLGLSNLWDIKTGWVDCVNDGLYGFSPKTYYKSGNIYSRLDDSFLFRYDVLELEDYWFLGIQDEDYVYRAKNVSVDNQSKITEVIKLNFKGEIVQRWKTDFLEPGMDSDHCFYIHDNMAMIYCESREYPRNYRLYNLDTGEVVWNFELTPEMNGMFTFVNGTFYIQGSYLAARVKPDGTKTYAYFPSNPQYITLDGHQYYLKGIPSSDPESLQCRLIRLEEDGGVETDLIVPCYPNYAVDGKRLVGWKEHEKFFKDGRKVSYEYCIQNLGKLGFSKPDIKQVELSEYDCSVDFAHLKAIELIDEGKARVTDLSGDITNREISILEPGETVADYISMSVLLKGDLLAVYRQDISGNDFVDCASVYNIASGKRIGHRKLQKGSAFMRTDLWLTSTYKTDKLCFTGNVLIAWREDKTSINIINLLNNELISPNDHDKLYEFNDRVYYKYKDKFVILNPETMEMKEFDSTKIRSTEPLNLLWLEQYGLDQVFGQGSYPQWYIPGVIYHKVVDWFASDHNTYTDNDYIQIKPCPAFSIKRSSNNEFVITNTSPNCQTPLNANVYLIPWPDDWCPAYWQARNVVVRVKDLKLNDISAITIPDLELLQSKRFALVIESNGLLDTRNSQLSDFDKTERPLFDGNTISYDEQRAVVVTMWESK